MPFGNEIVDTNPSSKGGFRYRLLLLVIVELALPMASGLKLWRFYPSRAEPTRRRAGFASSALPSAAIPVARGVLFGQTPSGRVQVNKTSFSPDEIHLEATNGPRCGTAVVQVLAERIPGLANPTVTVIVGEYSSNPPGVTVKIENRDPRNGTATLKSIMEDFTFSVCATGSVTGAVTLEADIWEVQPRSDYSKESQASPERGRTIFAVMP